MSRVFKLARLVAPALVAGALLSSCKSKDSDVRCGFCGMKVAHDSAWRSEVKRPDGRVDAFDTPRCAFGAVVKGDEPKGSVVRVQEFYDRTWQDAATVRFAVGSDVTGPMGADLVPVLPTHADKFSHDHSASNVVDAAQVNAALLADLH